MYSTSLKFEIKSRLIRKMKELSGNNPSDLKSTLKEVGDINKTRIEIVKDSIDSYNKKLEQIEKETNDSFNIIFNVVISEEERDGNDEVVNILRAGQKEVNSLILRSGYAAAFEKLKEVFDDAYYGINV